MVIENSGEVGIGTDEPDYKLDVNGTGRFTGSLNLPSGIWNSSGDVGIGTSTITAKLEILSDRTWDQGTDSGLKIKSDDGTTHDYVYINTSSNHYAAIQAYEQLEGANNLYIQPGGGNVGVGAATASSKLDVNGDIETGSGNALYFGDPNTDGSWRIIRIGVNLEIQRRESSVWTTKDTISP
jgi:hypothetical protein